jgi:hypothetical protein
MCRSWPPPISPARQLTDSAKSPPQSFAQLLRDDHVGSHRRAAGSGRLQSPDLPPPPAHRPMPTFWAPKSVRASPQVHRPIDRFDQFHRRGTILTFLWQYSTRQAVSLQTMRRRPEYGHPPKTPPSPAVEGKRHSHLLPSTTESREFHSQLGVQASSRKTRASFCRLAERLGDRPSDTLHRPFSPSNPWRT